MKRVILNQKGFEVLGVMVALMFVAAIGLVGYKVVSMNKTPATEQSSVVSGAQVAVPATLKTSADLTTTSKALDSSSSQLDSNLNDSSLDVDLKTLE